MSETRWYHSENGKALGPVSEQGMRGMIKESKLGADDLIWTVGMERWEPIAKLKEEWLKPEPQPEPVLAPVLVASPQLKPQPQDQPSVAVAVADKVKTGKVTVNAPLPAVAMAGGPKPLKPAVPEPMRPGAKGVPGVKGAPAPMVKPVGEPAKVVKEEPEKKGLFGKWFKRS